MIRRYLLLILVGVTAVLPFPSNHILPVVEFDAADKSSVVINDMNEVVKWKGRKNSEEIGQEYSWSLSSLSPDSRPLYVNDKDGNGRPYIVFSKNKSLTFDNFDAVYIDTGNVGSTLIMVVQNDQNRANVIFGSDGKEAFVRFDNPKTIRMSSSKKLFPIRDSMNEFHSYIIRGMKHFVELYQDGLVVARKKTSRSSDSFNGIKMRRIYFSGKVTYMAFYDHFLADDELKALTFKLNYICNHSNAIDLKKRSEGKNLFNISYPREYQDNIRDRENSEVAVESSSQPAASSERVLRTENDYIHTSIQTLEVMSERTTDDDIIHIAVTGFLVVSTCCLVPWCFVLLFFVYKSCFSHFSSNESKPHDYARYAMKNQALSFNHMANSHGHSKSLRRQKSTSRRRGGSHSIIISS